MAKRRKIRKVRASPAVDRAIIAHYGKPALKKKRGKK
jgi:hypothetical protein